MRVVMITRSQSGVPGGAGVPGGQIGMVQLARSLVRLGVDVELFVGGPLMSYVSGLDGVAAKCFRWPVWLDRLIRASPGQFRARGADLRRRRWVAAVAALPGIATADAIHVQGLLDTEALLTRFSGPVVVTHWGRVRRWQPQGLSADADRVPRGPDPAAPRACEGGGDRRGAGRGAIGGGPAPGGGHPAGDRLASLPARRSRRSPAAGGARR